MSLDISSCLCDPGTKLNCGIGPCGRCRGCNTNLTSSVLPGGGIDWNSINQRQRLIQGTVRVPSSEYIMNLGALNVYDVSFGYFQNGSNIFQNNQSSDRALPSGSNASHLQGAFFGNNTPTRGNSTKSSITRLRPGSSSAPTTKNVNSWGVDIKHNSYARYLAKKKGKSALRQGRVEQGSTMLTTNPTPIYGGKNVKFSIVRGNCICINA